MTRGRSSGLQRAYGVISDRVDVTVVAFPALKLAELKALRAGHNRRQHHAAFAIRTTGPTDRKQARFGARILCPHRALLFPMDVVTSGEKQHGAVGLSLLFNFAHSKN